MAQIFNLIYEKWIPISRATGEKEKIAPWQIGEKDIIAFAAPRPDFNGALAQFLIGLVQTTMPPKEEEWEDLFEKPPSPERLKSAFETVAGAFNLNGDGPRFMQELKLDERKNANSNPTSYLLIDAPTDNTLKENKAHFVKEEVYHNRNAETPFCLPCAATALYTFQTFAPSGGGGGGGKFTSLRGGGPLSTLVLGDNIWVTIWNNILAENYLINPKPLEYTMPWINPSNFIKESTKKDTHSAEMNSLHVYWNMPRRMLLRIQQLEKPTTCSICRESCSRIVEGYYDATMGMSYYRKISKTKKETTWIQPLHPLTPYVLQPGQPPSAYHARGGAVSYRYWLGYLIEDKKKNLFPATAVFKYRNNAFAPRDIRLWVYGYDMDNMKAVSWIESVMPVINVRKETRKSFEYDIAKLISAAAEIANNTCFSLKKAWLSPHSKAKIDTSLFEVVKASFWQDTEKSFYKTLHEVKEINENSADKIPVFEKWYKVLMEESFGLFDRYTTTVEFEVMNPKRIAIARNDLHSNKIMKTMQDILELPKKEKPQKPVNRKGGKRKP